MGAYLLYIYFEAAKDAAKRFLGSLAVLLGLLALAISLKIVAVVGAQLGAFGGILFSIWQALAITFYLGWLRESSQYKKVRISELKNFDFSLFQSVISVLFIIYLFQWGVTMLTTGMEGAWAFAILQLLIVVLLNSLPETLYITGRDGIDGIQESFHFTTTNWIEWYIPYLLVLSPLLLGSFNSLPLILAQTHIFFPALPAIAVPSYLFPELEVLLLPLGLCLAHWFMLFRAKLYKELEGGSRRQRMFRQRMG